MTKGRSTLWVARDTLYAGAWMAVRVLSLALWVWLLVRELPAKDFGWLASVLSVSVFCSLFAPLGIPYLFFADAHAPEQTRTRWGEAFGATLLLGPLLAITGALAINSWLDKTSIPASATIAFLVADVVCGSIVQAGGLWGHAAGRLGVAAGLPAALVIARSIAAGTCLLFGSSGVADPLLGYMIAHASLMCAVTAATLAWVSHTSETVAPRIPTSATCAAAWRYAVMGAGSMTQGELDKPLLAKVMGLQNAGHYAMAYRICASLAMPATALSASMLPRWTAMHAQRDHNSIRQSVWMTILAITAIELALALALKGILWVLPPSIFGLYPQAWPWMHGLAWLGLALGLHQAGGSALLAIGRPLLRTTLDWLAFALLSLMAIIAYPAWGAHGVMSTCILAEAVAAVATMAALFASLKHAAGIPENTHDA